MTHDVNAEGQNYRRRCRLFFFFLSRRRRAPIPHDPRRALPYKDSQDRETLRPRTAEHTATGRDDDVAGAHPDAAFNPSKTRPETERRTAAAEEEKQNGGKGARARWRARLRTRSSASRGAMSVRTRTGELAGRSGAGSPPKKGEVGGLG
ncbi:hypothetical protein ACCO45_009276 [Purpureocillium lilacinum]|uniref:Uncharacterized protein n=1 Tax=Purpureocillium lilacinum TaxID=33203 RepID=A0ACC4DJ81_PURLI